MIMPHALRGLASRILLLACAASATASAQEPTFTHADTLRGSITAERAWWDVVFYDLHVRINPADSTIRGWNGITYRVTGPSRAMQIDLQTPLEVDSIVQDGRRLTYRRDGNAFFVTLAAKQPKGATNTVTVYYHGRPTIATRPPWDGGLIWARDPDGGPGSRRPASTSAPACGGPPRTLRPTSPTASGWPSRSPTRSRSSPTDACAGSSAPATDGPRGNGSSASPINNYDVAPYIGHYAQYTDTYAGEAGLLTLDFHPLEAHLEDARQQWNHVKPMLQCFESWFGPYPWYRDGYQLIEAPHLGMEHQSAVAYGNGFQNGYHGTDLSGTGWGLTWDFIVIHESAHEWWGNSITTADIADMWVHESFANYSESLVHGVPVRTGGGRAPTSGARGR